MSEVTGRTIPIWLRTLFLVNVLLLAPQGIGFFSPGNIPFPVAVTPLNARFIGAPYLAAAIGMILSALGRDLADIRILLFAFAVISGLVLGVTFAYWGDFAAKRVPIIWLVTYIVDPIAAAAALLTLRPLQSAQPGAHRLSALFRLEFGIFGAVGIFLVLVPGAAVLLWPWKINSLLSQVYGAFLLAFAVGALLSSGESRPSALLPPVASTLFLGLLGFAASLLQLDRFAPGLASGIWFGILVVVILAFSAALLSLLRAPARPLLPIRHPG
jgi:hypothetical protein